MESNGSEGDQGQRVEATSGAARNLPQPSTLSRRMQWTPVW